MQYPEYIEEVKKRIQTLQKEGNLEKWIMQYARQISLEDRELFLQKLVYREKDDQAVLEDFNAFIHEIEEDIYYFEVDFQAYNSWYDDDDTYIDLFAIGPALEKYYRLAEEYVSEGKLEFADEILQKLNEITIGAGDDAYSIADYDRLSIYLLCIYHLCSIPYDDFCDLTLYVSYLANDEKSRLYKVAHDFVAFAYSDKTLIHLFEKTKMTDAEKNAFLKEMINFYKHRADYCGELQMHNLLLMCYGKEGILDAAKDVIALYPRIVVNEMQSILHQGEYEKVYAYACDYLSRILAERNERLEYTQMIAECAFHLSKEEEERRALEEVFVHKYNEFSAFALLTRFSVSEDEKQALMEKAEQEPPFPVYYGSEKTDTKVYVSLLMGNVDPALEVLAAGKYMSDEDKLYYLLLLKIINEGNHDVYLRLCSNISSLSSMLPYSDIQDSINNWKKFHPSDEIEKQYIFDELLPYADKKARKILDARNHKIYSHAVNMLIAIAEAGVSLGKFATAEEFLDTYRDDYPRLRSFHKQLNEAGY